MSSPAPEGGRGRDNVFTRKIGPLPMWQWFLIALAMVGAYVLYQYRKNNQAAASTANTAAGTSTGGTTGAGQVPQFVNQVYTYGQPPAAQPPPPSQHAQPSPHPKPAPSGGTTTPPAAQGVGTLTGSGYGASTQGGTVTTSAGQKYTWVNPQQAQQVVSSGGNLYFQPSPGLFVVAPTGATMGQGTPLFSKTG